MGGIGDDACVSSSWPGGRTGGEVCCLLQLVVQQILRKSEQLEFVLYRVRTGCHGCHRVTGVRDFIWVGSPLSVSDLFLRSSTRTYRTTTSELLFLCW